MNAAQISRHEVTEPIRATIFEITTQSMEVLRLVHYENGEFDILRGGRPVGPTRWKDSDLEACIEFYRALVRGIQPPGSDGDGGRKRRGADA